MMKLTRILVPCIAVSMAACSPGDKGATRKPEARERIRTVLENADSGTVVPLVISDTIHISPSTVEFYRARRWRPAWASDEALTSQGEKIVEALGATRKDGLDPSRYRYDVVTKMTESMDDDSDSFDDAARAKYAADVDMLLTETFGRFAMDLAQGTLDPDSAGLNWRIPRGGVPKEGLLRLLIKGVEPKALVERIRPTAPQYARLMNVLARLEDTKQKGGWSVVPEGSISRGDSSATVIALRNRLATSEDSREAALARRGANRPAVYDHDLFLALQHFQDRNAIDADGAIGEKTLAELNRPIDDRINEVKINMDRWRWLPHDLGKMYVMVNVAGFEMSVIEKGRVIEEMNVVVGQEGWETPIFADTLESMVVNPYWNVPPSIVEEEMGHLANDPDYLARNNFERTPDGGLRQRPGPRNALGEFKFQFPNKDNIYLHDTPADALFSRSSRAFSHGCIRLERPRDLAYLLGRKLAGKTPRQIDALQATGENHWITFRRKIPIYILYFTTWVDDDGTVRYHHDVYRLNKALEEQTERFQPRGVS